MKIDGVKGRPIRSTTTRKAAGSRGASSSKSMSPLGAGNDKVEVSDHAQTMDLIRDIVDATPDVRVDEVDRIVGQLKGGKYKIDFEKVADGFIKEAILNEVAKRQGRGR